MFGSIGAPELILLFVVALLVFGPRKLPELGKTLGKGLSEFRRASNELKSTLEEEVRAEDRARRPAASPRQEPVAARPLPAPEEPLTEGPPVASTEPTPSAPSAPDA